LKRSALKRYMAAPRPSSPQTARAAVIATNGDGGHGRQPSPEPASLAEYPGSKNGNGVWQTIINNLPPHDVFVEAFAGSAIVTRKKRPARSTIVIDSDAAVTAALTTHFLPANARLVEQFGLAEFGDHEAIVGNVRVIRADAVAWLEKNRGSLNRRTVIYCDPPYLFDTRRDRSRRYYGHEFGEEWLHGELLAVLSRLNTQDVPCLISGRSHPLYDRMLASWRRVDYQTSTHGGPVTESLWCNFDAPAALHDYRFLGRNFRERERIVRKQRRWRARLAGMDPLERAGIVEAVRDLLDENGEGAPSPKTAMRPA